MFPPFLWLAGRGLAKKEIETKLLAARRRANVVVLMDKYLQLKKQCVASTPLDFPQTRLPTAPSPPPLSPFSVNEVRRPGRNAKEAAKLWESNADSAFVLFSDANWARYEELKSFAGISQMFLGDFNKSLQNVRGLVLWTDPRVSFFFVFGCFALSLFLFFCGMKCTLQLAGLYLLRPPCLRNPFPPLPFQPFYRLSSIQESPLWCYMKIQQR